MSTIVIMNPPNPPIISGPFYNFDSGTGVLSITGACSPSNYSITLSSITCQTTLSDGSIGIGVEIDIQSDPLSTAPNPFNFSLDINISACSNTDNIGVGINDLTDPSNVRRYDQLIGAAVKLPPKNIIVTVGSAAQEAERILLTVELEALNILDRMLIGFSNYYKTTFKTEAPKGYGEFTQYIEKAQNSLKSGMKELNSLKSVVEVGEE